VSASASAPDLMVVRPVERSPAMRMVPVRVAGVRTAMSQRSASTAMIALTSAATGPDHVLLSPMKPAIGLARRC